ncbi:MAG: DMT family transporter [Deferrisomatales bacterium]|nr:DMT family transporter [Deferrisomatales bacterium]
MTLSRGQRHMVLATLLFTAMGVLVKHLRHIPAHEVVFFRAAVTLVLSWTALRRAGVSPWGNNRRLLLARGAAGTAALLIYFYTLQHMPLASAVTVQYLSPLFTILLSGLFLGEAATPRQWAFFGLCFAGVAAIKGFDPRVALPDLALGVLAAALAGVAYNLVRRLKGSDTPMVVVFYFPLVTFPVIGPYTLTHWVMPRGIEWLWLLAVGLLTQAAQVSLTKAYHLEPAVNISHLTYLGTLWALLLGYLVFGETVPLPALVGIGLVVLGVVLASRAGTGNGNGGTQGPTAETGPAG